ncbi:MAG: chemotaxis protein CheD [Desulfobacter sp.]|nr:MAG: chemotaxis protein CheD [Desulfobacter sp.]
MNHFLFPWSDAKSKSTPVYGNIAVLALIQMMLNKGSKRSHLEAQVFGGAFNADLTAKDIGKDNLQTARQVLNKRRIKIVSEDVGGSVGRKVVFNTLSYEIGILKVDRLRDSDWYPYEKDRD